MRLIIAGSRGFGGLTRSQLRDLISQSVAEHGLTTRVTEVVSGCCPEVDLAGEEWAEKCRGLPVRRFPADWKANGRAAGPIRNRQMAEYAASVDGPGGALLALWDGESHGTANMIAETYKVELPVYIVRPKWAD